MGHKAHPTCKPKQLQNNDNKSSISGENSGTTYELKNRNDETLIEVRKNGSFEGYIFMGEIVDEMID